MISDMLSNLRKNGYVVIPNVLSPEEVAMATSKFDKWQKTIPDHDFIHNACNPRGIYKHHEAVQQDHAWYIRTRPGVQSPFKEIWDTEDIIVSFDGSK
jgi:hypothetical protein